MTWEVQDIMMHQRLILELKKIVHHTLVEFHQKLDIGCV